MGICQLWFSYKIKKATFFDILFAFWLTNIKKCAILYTETEKRDDPRKNKQKKVGKMKEKTKNFCVAVYLEKRFEEMLGKGIVEVSCDLMVTVNGKDKDEAEATAKRVAWLLDELDGLPYGTTESVPEAKKYEFADLFPDEFAWKVVFPL